MNHSSDYLRDGQDLDAFINSTLDELIPAQAVQAHASSSIADATINLDLFKSSVKLAMRNVVKKLITHERKKLITGELEKCIYCLSDTSNIINVCVCGLENVCYTCFMKRNMDLVIQHANPSLINEHTDRICEHKLLELLKVINCQVCGDNSHLKASIDKYKLHYDEPIIKSYDILHDINYYALENKQLFEHISNFDVYIKLFKNPVGLTEFGYVLEISQSPDPVLTIKLNSATCENILSKIHKTGKVSCSDIKLQIKNTQYFVLDAIYYKCVEYGMAYLEKIRQPDMDETKALSIFLVKWNRFCSSINRLIQYYMDNASCCKYEICIVFLDILKTIQI